MHAIAIARIKTGHAPGSSRLSLIQARLLSQHTLYSRSCAPYAHATASPQRGRSCGPRDMRRQIAMSRQTANDSATTSAQSLVRAAAAASGRTRIGAQRVQRDIQCQTTTASTSDKAVRARLSQTAEPHLCSYVKRRRHIRCLAAKIAEPC